METHFFKEDTLNDGKTPVLSLKPQVFFALCAALLLFAVLVAIAVFFLRVRGAEEVMVPDVQGKDIIPALLELQNKELDARIQLRYSPVDRGGIIEQDPRPGTIVKAGRKIRLVISQGALLSNVGNYMGRKVDDVRSELKTLFGAATTPLITIKDPILYQYSLEPVGTILEQDPLPGTGISAPLELNLVVSRGEEALSTKMPSLTGKKVDGALDAISKAGIRWVFTTQPGENGETAGTIVAQEPASGNVLTTNQVATLTVVEPRPADIKDNETAGLFRLQLSENPYPMQTTLEAIFPDGERKTLVNMGHYGGEFTYPYLVPKGTIFVVSLLKREIHRETVQ
ncbi:MAG: PASTA domain-containing protein [Spirochaetaceae bacterium]|jgi:beta-lactam-binding protein with PASTA domain|nr:PASTA domain-containing protein [Spirochaetaceae bacterium]